MVTFVEFISSSEDSEFEKKTSLFSLVLPGAIIEYVPRGGTRRLANEKTVKQKRSTLFVRCEETDYCISIIRILGVYEQLESYYHQIEHDSFINISFFSNDMVSLEFSTDVLAMIAANKLSLPISVYWSLESSRNP